MLEVIAEVSASGFEMTLTDEVEDCTLAEFVTEIEFALEGWFADCDEPDVTGVLTVDVAVCDGFEKLGLLIEPGHGKVVA